MTIQMTRKTYADFVQGKYTGQSDDVLFDLAGDLFVLAKNESGARRTGTYILAQTFESISRDYYSSPLPMADATALHNKIDPPILQLLDAIDSENPGKIYDALDRLTETLSLL